MTVAIVGVETALVVRQAEAQPEVLPERVNA